MRSVAIGRGMLRVGWGGGGGADGGDRPMRCHEG